MAYMRLPRWLSGKESTCQYRKQWFDLWVEMKPCVGNCSAVQYSCLGNPVDRGAWWATVHGITRNQGGLSNWVHTHIVYMRIHSSQPLHCTVLCV